MQKNVYAIKGFTSYFDRKVRRLESFGDYVSDREYWASLLVHFQPNDGINASVVFLLSTDEVEAISKTGTPNYVIVCDMTNVVQSRWYVMECVFIRECQYELKLRRDVVADYMESVLLAPCYMDRGPLSKDSPFIFNREDISLNQIKVKELLIKDESESAWIVGYVSSDTTDTSTVVADTAQSLTSEYPTIAQALPGIAWTDAADLSKGGTFEGCNAGIDYIASNYIYKPTPGLSTDFKTFYLHGQPVGNDSAQFRVEEIFAWDQGYGSNAAVKNSISDFSAVYSEAIGNVRKWVDKIFAQRNGLESAFATKNSVGTLAQYQAVLAANGQIFYDSVNQKYYRLTVTEASTRTLRDNLPNDELPDLRTRLLAIARELAGELQDGEYNENGYFAAIATLSKLTVGAEEVFVDGQIKTTMSATRRHLVDAPYDMFCLKFNEQNLALAQRIVSAPPGAGQVKKIYDLQILPYCPRRDVIPTVDLANLTDTVDYQTIYLTQDGTDTAIDVLYWCIRSSASFVFDVPPSGSDWDPLRGVGLRTANAAMNLKLSDECELFRLSAPNYSASFDFSLARNGGSVSGFRVDFTYRPVMPYIHVAPIFNGLYGTFNNDARGLICGGDFSVDMISDPWTEYMSNNKNYENIFNTSIKRMDAIREYDRGALALSGTLTTAAAAVAGAAKGGVAGAIVGAGVGLTRSIGQAVVSEGKFQAERKAAIETFNYELGNVKAAPNTLTKVSAYNVNNKYFPLVELYTCTLGEEEALINYFTLYNFKIGAMATIGEVLDAGRTKEWEYVKGRISLFEGVVGSEDSHFLEEVYAEIDRGVFIYG